MLVVKRIHKEIEDNITNSVFKHAIVKYNIESSESSESSTTIQLTIYNKEFNMAENYPFVKPKVKVNNRPYLSYLKPPTKRIYSILHKLKYTCPCCNTILNNWSPAYTLIKILDEIDNYNYIKRDVKHHMILEELGIKYHIIDQLSGIIIEYLR